MSFAEAERERNVETSQCQMCIKCLNVKLYCRLLKICNVTIWDCKWGKCILHKRCCVAQGGVKVYCFLNINKWISCRSYNLFAYYLLIAVIQMQWWVITYQSVESWTYNAEPANSAKNLSQICDYIWLVYRFSGVYKWVQVSSGLTFESFPTPPYVT